MASWVLISSPCCHRHCDVLLFNKYKAQNFASDLPKGGWDGCEGDVRAPKSLANLWFMTKTCTSCLGAVLKHQYFPQGTFFCLCSEGKDAPFPQKSAKPLPGGLLCPGSLPAAPDPLEVIKKSCCRWLRQGRDKLSNAAPEGILNFLVMVTLNSCPPSCFQCNL